MSTASLRTAEEIERAKPIASEPVARVGFLRALPWTLAVVAVVAALLHLMPVWHAASETPDGWVFTGNTRLSPDFMQYRVWTRLSRQTGILVENTFTTEPNRPHLPVVFYWVVGKVSQATGYGPEFVVTGFGALFAAAFSVLLFATVRRFFPVPHQAWWIFFAILVGGGLGAHLRVLTDFHFVRGNFILDRTIVAGVRSTETWEDLRGPYPFISLFDAHYLMVWLLATGAVMALYFALRRPTVARVALTLALYATITVLHIYEAVTLMSITAGVVLLLWRRGLLTRGGLVVAALCGITSVACLALLLSIYRSGGLPVASWRAPAVLLSSVLLAHPLAWLVMARGLGSYWRNAGFDRLFALGWLAGCLVLTLSSPYYAWPDRGTMTMAIPVYLVAGGIYFAGRPRLSRPAIVAIVVVMGLTPVWMIQKRWKTTEFSEDRPYTFLGPSHQAILATLNGAASRDDILLAEERDLLWLAPDYPGRHYCAHFFLTVRYERKRAEVARFFEGGDETARREFLTAKGVRFLYVDAARNPERFAAIPGVRLMRETPVGSLFEVMREPRIAGSGAAVPANGGGGGS